MIDKLLVLSHPRIIHMAVRASCLRSVQIAADTPDGRYAELLQLVHERSIRIERVPHKVLQQRYPQSRGIVGLSDPPKPQSLGAWWSQAGNHAGVVLLDHIEDPHNVGAIIRSAEELDMDMVLVPRVRSAPISDVVASTSAGAIFTMPLGFVAGNVQLMKEFRRRGFWIYAADMDGVPIDTCDLTSKTLIIIGNEGKGLSHAVKQYSDQVISIPSQGKIGSLNASVAAGVVFYERLRQIKL